ncbi:MAG: hypothetical protein DI585_05925 [Pseudomonas fluorescens]|nr:MAG: hypothetical protein DI585_05925 [Pseudomonas fluorescens]
MTVMTLEHAVQELHRLSLKHKIERKPLFDFYESHKADILVELDKVVGRRVLKQAVMKVFSARGYSLDDILAIRMATDLQTFRRPPVPQRTRKPGYRRLHNSV